MNNVNHDFPALMSDGRHATDYRPSCVAYNLIMQHNGLKNSHQQRLFMQRNSEQLQAINLRHFTHLAKGSKVYRHVDPNGHDAFWRAYKASLTQ